MDSSFYSYFHFNNKLMKRIYNFFFVILFSFTVSMSFVDAQVIKGGLILGGNLSQVDGDEVYGFKRIGFNVGATAIVPFTEKWSLSIETIFSQEGAYQKPTGLIENYALYEINPNGDTLTRFIDITGGYDLRLGYVRIPILAHFTDRRLSFGLGAQYGRLVYVNEVEQGGMDGFPGYNTTDSLPFKKNDLSLIADIKVRIWKGLYANVRYSYSIIPIRERTFYNTKDPTVPWQRKQFNNTLSFRLMWIFNDNSGTLKKQGVKNPGI